MKDARNPPDRDEWRIPTPPRMPRINYTADELTPPSGSLGASSMSGNPGVRVSVGKYRVHVGTAALVAVVTALGAAGVSQATASGGAEDAVQDLRRELRELRQEMRQEIRAVRDEVRAGR